jgi:hypothetical protein
MATRRLVVVRVADTRLRAAPVRVLSMVVLVEQDTRVAMVVLARRAQGILEMCRAVLVLVVEVQVVALVPRAG